jgi:hypothetical protein
MLDSNPLSVPSHEKFSKGSFNGAYWSAVYPLINVTV